MAIKHTFSIAIVITVLLLTAVSPAIAGNPVWMAIGPAQESIEAIAISSGTPALLFAGTSDGKVFKSANHGATWTLAVNGLPVGSNVTGTTVKAIATDPNNSSVFYAAVLGAGLYRTSDGGGTWSLVAPAATTRSIAVDGTAFPTKVYVGTDDGVLKSNNGEDTWVLLAGSPRGASALAVDPVQPLDVYAAAPYFGMFKSTNGGNTWAASGTGLVGAVAAIVIDPGDPAIVYAGTTTNGMFKSSNGGGTWIAKNSGIGNLFVAAVCIDPADPDVVYAASGGVAVTNDNGDTWAQNNTGLSSTAVRALAMDGGILYAGTTGGGVNALAEGLIENAGTSARFLSLAVAYAAASDNAELRARNTTFYEDLSLDRPVAVLIGGGYEAEFDFVTGVTLLDGTLTVGSGSLRVENLTIL